MSAIQSSKFECVVCLLAYIGWSVSLYCLLVIMAYFHYTFLPSNNCNKTFVQYCPQEDVARFICFN